MDVTYVMRWRCGADGVNFYSPLILHLLLCELSLLCGHCFLFLSVSCSSLLLFPVSCFSVTLIYFLPSFFHLFLQWISSFLFFFSSFPQFSIPFSLGPPSLFLSRLLSLPLPCHLPFKACRPSRVCMWGMKTERRPASGGKRHSVRAKTDRAAFLPGCELQPDRFS